MGSFLRRLFLTVEGPASLSVTELVEVVSVNEVLTDETQICHLARPISIPTGNTQFSTRRVNKLDLWVNWNASHADLVPARGLISCQAKIPTTSEFASISCAMDIRSPRLGVSQSSSILIDRPGRASHSISTGPCSRCWTCVKLSVLCFANRQAMQPPTSSRIRIRRPSAPAQLWSVQLANPT
jgi:hypothetical protein